MVRAAIKRVPVSQRRACVLAGLNRSTWRYVARSRPDGELRRRLRELALERRRWGCPMITMVLRREGFTDNHKRIARIYREEGLQLRKRRRKRKAPGTRRRTPLTILEGPNQRWSMDFMHDALVGGRSLRILNIIDDFTRECVAMVVDTSLGGDRVSRVLDQLKEERGLPRVLLSDNGPEFTSLAMDQWAYREGVELQFIQPGKPTQNAFVESFNGTCRDNCLNEHWFGSLREAREIIEAWRIDYNTIRPHSSLNGATPKEFTRSFQNQKPSPMAWAT